MPKSEDDRSLGITPPLDKKGEQRRLLLKGFAVTVGGVVLNSLSPNLASAEDTTRPVLEPVDSRLALQSEVEELIQGRLTTIWEFPEVMREKSRRYASAVPKQWSEDNLKRFKGILSTLPEHFYLPNAGGPLTVILSERNGFLDFKTRNQLELCFGDIDSFNVRFNDDVVTHELGGHRIVEINFKNDEDGLKMESEWLDRFNQLFGGDYHQPPLELVEKVQSNLRSTSTDDQERVWFYKRMDYILGPRFAYEGVAVGTEVWRKGDEVFRKLYGELLPEEKLGEWVRFIKEDVFKGKVY